MEFVIMLIVLVFLAIIPASIAQGKGHSFWGYYVFGLCFFLPALVVSLLVKDKNEGQSANKLPESDIKYHVTVKHKGVGNGEGVGDVYREMYTCPECGHSWYINGSPRIAKCGLKSCGCRVYLER